MYSLDNYGVDYLLKLYEYLTYEDYLEALHNKDLDIKRGQQKAISEIDNVLKKVPTKE